MAGMRSKDSPNGSTVLRLRIPDLQSLNFAIKIDIRSCLGFSSPGSPPLCRTGEAGSVKTDEAFLSFVLFHLFYPLYYLLRAVLLSCELSAIRR